MKNTLKRLLVACSILLFASSVYAQDGSSSAINSFATVVTDFAVEGVRDMQFGFVLANTQKTVDARSEDAGQFNIVKTAAGIDITISATGLQQVGGTTILPFSHFNIARIVDANGVANDVALTGTGADRSIVGALAANAGFFDLFIGGTVDAADQGDPGDAVPGGVYQGTITVSLETI